MDSNSIIERIKDMGLLKNDSPEIWAEVVDEFPYFTIGQWLKYGNSFYSKQNKLGFASVYRVEPLNLVRILDSLKSNNFSNDEQVVDHNVIVPIDSYQEDMPSTDVQMFRESTIEEHAEKVERSTLDSEQISNEELMHFEDTEVNSNYSSPDKDKLSEDQHSNILPSDQAFMIHEKEDILDLINELPNTPLFEISSFEDQVIESRDEDIQLSEILVDNQEGETSIYIPGNEEPEQSLMIMMSFTDWLNHFKLKKQSEKEEENDRKALKTAWQKEKLAEAADEELDEIPEPIFKQAMESISMESSLISESLAEILAKQGKKDKAIAMYKKLSLRNPEKNTFFADRIRELNARGDY